MSQEVGNQTIKFIQLIECNMKKIFLAQNAVEKLFPEPFLKSQN